MIFLELALKPLLDVVDTLMMIAVFVFLFVSANSLVQRHVSHSPILMGLKNVNVRKGGNDDIPRVAKFLAESMYKTEIPTGQKRELIRLEQVDLTDRYGERVSSKGSLPSALFIAEEDEEIVGVVGLDCQLYQSRRQKLSKLPRDYFSKMKAKMLVSEEKDISDSDDSKFAAIVLVLANLSVRIDQRKKGIARTLLKACDDFTKELGSEEIYLLVDSENEAAQKLYRSSGYTLVFEDPDSTCVVSTVTGLQTAPCVNRCYRKNLAIKAPPSPTVPAGNAIIENLLGFFRKK
mmetsp:Transcript_30179/g.43103  ORF Transcript_30179/g.43103 Transcript_30179/m.43103 type:complete len:291 (-) Transcript_30179:101-973(-)